MHGNQSSADGKSNPRKRKLSGTEIIRNKFHRILYEIEINNEFASHLNDVPNYCEVESRNHSSIKKELMDYITFMDHQVSSGWVPSYGDVWLYCENRKYLNPEAISILLEDRASTKKTQGYRHYILEKLKETCRTCSKEYGSSRVRQLKKKASTTLGEAPKNVIYGCTDFCASLEMLEYFAELHEGLSLDKIAEELPLRALKMGHLDLAESYVRKYGAACFEGMKISETGCHEKISAGASSSKKCIPDQIYAVVSGSDKARLKEMVNEESVCLAPIYQKWTLAHFAAASSNSTFLELLLKKYGIHCLFHETEDGDRPLHVAARAGRLSNVKLILEAVHAEDEKILDQEAEFYEPLKNAMLDNEANNLPMSKEHGRVHALLSSQNSDSKNALSLAIAYGRNQVVDFLLLEYEKSHCIYHRKIDGKTVTYVFQTWFLGGMEDYYQDV